MTTSTASAPARAPSLPSSYPGLLIWATLGAVTLAEVLTTHGDPRWGMALHVALLSLFLSVGAVGGDPRLRAFALALTLVPMIRVVSLGMPLGQFDQPYWYLLSAVPLFSAAAVIIRLADLSPADIGLRLPRRRHLRLEGLVILCGFALGLGEYAILRPDPLADGAGPLGLIAAALILLVGTGLMEELVFRGILQTAARGVLSRAWALLYVSLLFGVLHLGHQSLLDVVFVTFVAIGFGLVVARTRSILGVSVAHGIVNIMLFLVLPRLIG